jgi:hypothetical protein
MFGPAEGGTVVMIEGTGFVAGATVQMGSEATEVEVLSPTEIKARTAASPVGSFPVVVTDAGGTSTDQVSFVYF